MDSIGRGVSAAAYAGADLYARGALADQQAAIQLERDKRLEEAGIRTEDRAVARADKQRTDQVTRVEEAAKAIVDKEIESKRGLINSRIGDKSTWTEEQQAAVDQALEAEKNQMSADGRTREKAAIATGDIAPKDAATIDREQRRLDSADKAAAQKAVSDERRDATQRYIAELRDDTAQKRIEALLKKTGKDSTGTKEALSFIDGVRKDLASEASNLKAMYSAELSSEIMPEEQKKIKESYKVKFDAIDAKRSQIEKDFDALREKVGLPASSKTDKPKQADTAPAGLPQGAKQIGTSGGKPVYETPDGQRFIQK